MTQTIDATRTLLLADGNATTQRVVALAFADEPVSVKTASDADDVVLSLQQGVPDIVLADVGLTGTTGYEVAEFMRRDERLAHVPVLLLAGAFDVVDRDKVAAAGIAGVVTKPFDPQALVERVRELLAGEPGGAARLEAGALPTPVSSPAVPAVPSTDVHVSDMRPHAGDGADAGEVRLRLDEHADLERPPAEAHPLASPGAAAPAPVRQPRAAEDRDRYFDQLDEAFAALATSPRPPVVSGEDVEEEIDVVAAAAFEPGLPVQPAPTPAASAVPVAPANPVPPSPSPSPAVQASPAPVPPSAAVRSAPPAEPPAMAVSPTVPPPSGPRVDALGDAFAALLESEESGEPPDLLWPADVASDAGREQAIARDLEPVVRRMLEQMADRVLKETVSAVVSGAADRLVREEIERIKRHIK